MYPSLQGRDTHVSPGVDLGPRRQQHPADLSVAFARRPVQRGAAPAPVVLRGRGAGHRPQQVPHRAEQTPVGRPDDVVAASGGHGPPREGPGRAANPIPFGRDQMEITRKHLWENVLRCLEDMKLVTL